MSMAKLTLHGIRNCDTVKKARAWLDRRGIEYDFHDYKTRGARWISCSRSLRSSSGPS